MAVGAQSADMGDIVFALIERMGGPDGIAEKANMVFNAAPEGGNVQARVLQSTLTIIEKYMSRNPTDDDDVSDEELAELIEPLVAEHNKN